MIRLIILILFLLFLKNSYAAEVCLVSTNNLEEKVNYILNWISNRNFMVKDDKFNTINIKNSTGSGGFVVLEPLATAPTSPVMGTMYCSSKDNKLKFFNGKTWDNVNK